MESAKVIARYLNGRILTGFTHDFFPNKDRFHLYSSATADRKCHVVLLEELKAVLFVRDFDGNSRERKGDHHGEQRAGRRMEVTFLDGEILLGSTLGYGRSRAGFFLFPADPRANNLQVFVVSKALRTVRYLTEPEDRGGPPEFLHSRAPGLPGTSSNPAPPSDIPLGRLTVTAALPRRPRECRRAERIVPDKPLEARLFCYAHLPVLNISATGLLVECTERFVPGVRCQVELARSGQRVQLHGEVVRCVVAALGSGCPGIEYRTAVQFLETFPPLFALLPELSEDPGLSAAAETSQFLDGETADLSLEAA